MYVAIAIERKLDIETISNLVPKFSVRKAASWEV